MEVLKDFVANTTIDKREKATVLSMTLEQEFRRTPHNMANPHFKESQDYHLALLESLESIQSTDQVPLLAAIIDEKPKSSVEPDINGLGRQVNYADGSYRSVTRQDGKVTGFCYTAKDGKKEKWVKDAQSGGFYRDGDATGKSSWKCEVELSENGDFVITDAPEPSAGYGLGLEEYGHGQLAIAYSAGRAGQRTAGNTITSQYGSTTTFTRDGAKVVEIPLGKPVFADGVHAEADKWVQVTYADGSIRWQDATAKDKVCSILNQ